MDWAFPGTMCSKSPDNHKSAGSEGQRTDECQHEMSHQEITWQPCTKLPTQITDVHPSVGEEEGESSVLQ